VANLENVKIELIQKEYQSDESMDEDKLKIGLDR